MSNLQCKLIDIYRLKPFVLWISVIRKHKQPLLILEFAQVMQDLNFVMIGSSVSSEDDLANELRKKSERINNLFWLGHVSEENKIELLKECSAGITTSRLEGFGWSPFEFLYYNKPILAYPLDVFQEIYGDLVIYAKNKDEFIQKLKKLKNDGFDFDINRKRVLQIRQKYSVKRSAKKIIDNYTKDSHILILARDFPKGSSIIQGNFKIEWELWANFCDYSNSIFIISNGNEYLERMNICDKNIFKLQKINVDRFESSKEPEISLMLFFWYVRHSIYFIFKNKSSVLITSGAHLTFLQAILSLFFSIQTISVIHDVSAINQKEISFIDKIKHRLLIWSYRKMDHVLTVSKTSSIEIAHIIERDVDVIWEIQSNSYVNISTEQGVFYNGKTI